MTALVLGVATWSAEGRPRPEMPRTHVLDQIRAQVRDPAVSPASPDELL